MAKKKLEGIVWPNLPDDTYYLDAEKVEYSEDETYPSGSVGKALSEKAKTDGYYSNLTAGSAEQLLSTVTIEDEVPYQFRTSGGSADIGDRETDMLVGGTVAWNQLINQSKYNTGTDQGVTHIVDADGVTMTLNGTATGLFRVTQQVMSSGRKYYVADANHNVPLGDGYNHNVGTGGGVISPTGTSLYVVSATGTVFDNTKIKIVCHDLTQMFGSTIADYIYSLETANAGAGVAWFRKLFPKPYYEYNAGELMSVKTSAHEMVGFNAWDEEWELGSLTGTGENATSSTEIRSKNYIDVLPNTTYYLHCGVQATFNYRFYDADKNFLSGSYIDKGSTLTTPTNARYMRFYMGSTYGTTYNHDICINLSWDGERNGEYEPYIKHSYPLDDSLTLRGVPKLDSSNNLYYDGDTYESDGTVTRKYGIVDLGTLTWSAQTDTVGQYFQSALAGAKPAPQGSSNVGNAICSKYPIMPSANVVDKSFAISTSVVADVPIYVRDTSYTDAATFKTAMDGVYLVYELATPTTETAEPFTNPQIVDDFGTEEYVTTSIVPVGHKTQYMPNLRAKLEMAPNSPNGNGDYIVRQTNGMNEYVPLVIKDTLPTIPSTAGSYKLTVTVTEGSDPVLSWEAE